MLLHAKVTRHEKSLIMHYTNSEKQLKLNPDNRKHACDNNGYTK